jgi:hypothetical protein
VLLCWAEWGKSRFLDRFQGRLGRRNQDCLAHTKKGAANACMGCFHRNLVYNQHKLRQFGPGFPQIASRKFLNTNVDAVEKGNFLHKFFTANRRFLNRL